MNVQVIAVDGKMPNLALMKIAAWHKSKGDTVGFNISDPDKVYISTIFDWNGSQSYGIPKLFNCTVEIGGSGVDIQKDLPGDIEHIMPDYSLYDIDYSMGFTSRGCPNNCPFCIVPIKEGAITDHAYITEFLHPDHNKVILLDNNFLASPRWRGNLNYIIEHDIMVNFCQGNDIRRINEDNAKLLSETKFSNYKFNRKQMHFAWDIPEIEKSVERGINIFNDAGVKPYNLMFYVLCGFNTSFEQDMYRVMRLREWGCDPFVMVYNNRRDDKRLRDFARWVNRKEIFKSCTFDEYNSKEVVNVS